MHDVCVPESRRAILGQQLAVLTAGPDPRNGPVGIRSAPSLGDHGGGVPRQPRCMKWGMCNAGHEPALAGPTDRGAAARDSAVGTRLWATLTARYRPVVHEPMALGVDIPSPRARSMCLSGRGRCLPRRRWCSPRRPAGCWRGTSQGACFDEPGSPRRFTGSGRARSWMAETGVPAEVAEACLAHVPRSRVVQAYQRSDLLERRRRSCRRGAITSRSDRPPPP